MRRAAVSLVLLLGLRATSAHAQPAPWGDSSPEGGPRVGLVVESTGRPQEVRLERGEAPRCLTPCTLELPPGYYHVLTGGRGLRLAETPVELGPRGARLVVRSASRAGYLGGIVLTSAGAATLFSFGLMSVMAYASFPEDEYNQLMAGIFGGMALLLGAPLLIGGILWLRSTRSGVHHLGELAARPTWGLGLAPLPNGGAAGLRVSF